MAEDANANQDAQSGADDGLRAALGKAAQSNNSPGPDSQRRSGAETRDDSDGGKEWAPPASQAELDKIIAGVVARERSKYDHLRAAAAELAEIKESQKSEAEKAQDRIRGLEDRATTAEAALARYEVARDKGVAEWADLLSGDREEMEAQADRILARLKQLNTPRSPRPDPAQGRNGTSGPMTAEDAFAAVLGPQLNR